MNKQVLNYMMVIGVLILLCGCTKFLEEKPLSSLSIPETYRDLRALMDNPSTVNMQYPGNMEVGCDDYFVPYNQLAARPGYEQMVYKWISNEQRTDLAGWNNAYAKVMVSNVVLEGLERIDGGTASDRDILRGEAVFLRAYNFYYLAQLFCPIYDHSTKDLRLGLPLRATSDFNVKFPRSTVEETYAFIIAELEVAMALLPVEVKYKTRPNRATAYGALAKVYLSMRRYDEARTYARLALNDNPALLDYNSIQPAAAFPFPTFHAEVIYHCFSTSGLLLAPSRARIVPELYALFDDHDIRKRAFFDRNADGTFTFKGHYVGSSSYYFAGIAKDELMLIEAECEVRSGNVEGGMDILNDLLVTRWEVGTYPGFQAETGQEALSIILRERRKQLIRRGVRWVDMRRLSFEAENAFSMTRTIDTGQDIEKWEIGPGDNRLIYPIPVEVMAFNDFDQNPI